MRWFSKNLGDGIVAVEPLHRLETLFSATYGRAAHPNERAIFVRHESEGRLHCEVIVYFSPASAGVAKAAGAAPCARPSPDGLRLLAGSEESWRALFPERHG